MKTQEVNIGELIKKRKLELGISDAELARRINTTRQNIGHILKLKSIDTDQLLLLSKELQYDFFKHYQNEESKTTLDKKAKILIELEIDSDEILKLGIKDKVLQILNK